MGGRGYQRGGGKNTCPLPVYISPFYHCSLLPASAYPVIHQQLFCCLFHTECGGTQGLSNPALIHPWYNGRCTPSTKEGKKTHFHWMVGRVNDCNGGKQGCDQRRRRGFPLEVTDNRENRTIYEEVWPNVVELDLYSLSSSTAMMKSGGWCTRKEGPHQPLQEQVQCSFCQNSFDKSISVSSVAN